MRDGMRRPGPWLVAVAAVGIGVAFVGRAAPWDSHSGIPTIQSGSAHDGSSLSPQDHAGLKTSLDAAYAEAMSRLAGKSFPTASGVNAPAQGGDTSRAVQVAKQLASTPGFTVTPLRKLRPADLLVVAPTSLRSSVATAVRRLPGVAAVAQVDAAAIRVNGQFVQMLGVDPGSFRAFAAAPTARSTSLWRGVAAGDIAVSYTMGKQDKMPLGGTVRVAGTRPEVLRVGGYGTVGIAGVDAVVSESVAQTLGFPSRNAMVISAPHAELATLMTKLKTILPRHASIAPLVGQVEPGEVVTTQLAATGAAGAPPALTAHGSPMTMAQARAFLTAALSRVGMPYVWGAAGPTSFDCSGLVQWSMRQAGITMPRVADDQARTGPLVSISDLRPGDLLFFHTDPTAPSYISHVAIYLGNDLMVQAPEPGMDVQVVKAILGGPGFAGAVEVFPATAAAVAADPAG